jgi:ribonuclease BN (tRNA processing enzyme)
MLRKRTRPLLIAGPPGMRKRTLDAMEILFPGSSRIPWIFPLEMIELEPDHPRTLGRITVTPYLVEHPCGDPPLALRIECDGRVIAYSGDTIWVDALIQAAAGADLFIVEAYTYDKKTKLHMDLKTLVSHLGEIAAKRTILTHLSAEMIARAADLPYECAADGKIVEIA